MTFHRDECHSKLHVYKGEDELAPYRRRIWQGTGRGNGCQGLLKRYGGNNIYITKIRFLLYTCQQRNRMNLIYEKRSINLLVEPSRGVDSSTRAQLQSLDNELHH